jgi:hypothetical protein
VIGKVTANDTWFPSWNDKYSVATFPINPANPKTFPWLSYIARLYDKYRFYGIKFMFVNAVSTQTEGNLMMSLDYDTLDEAPANLVQASQLAKYKVSPLYCPCEFAIPVNHPGNSNWLYTFDLSATTNTVDLKTYNLGNFFLSLDGVPQDGKDYGYLAVEYDVELLDKNPVIDTFASKTWDSSAPVAKRSRSNVDPADTMDVAITYEMPEAQTQKNACTFTFSKDVTIGSKCRLNAYITAFFTSESSTNKLAEFASVDAGNQTVLAFDSDQTLVTNTSGKNTSCLVCLDITVPEDRSVTINLTTSTDSAFYHGTSPYAKYQCHAMAYTYA